MSHSNQNFLGPADAFVLYRLPGAESYFMVREFQGRPSTTPTWLNEKGFVFRPFQHSETSPEVFIHADEFLENPGIHFDPPIGRTWKPTLHSEYLDTATRFIEACRTKKYRKLVLSRLKTFPNKGKDPFSLFLSLHKSYPGAFVYLLNHPKSGCWMGASPEVFLRETHGKYETYSLAGTRPIQAEKSIGSWSQKDRIEQQFVTDYIAEKLQAFHLEFSVSGPSTQEAGTVEHLKTIFRFDHPGDKLQNLIHALHPTPAVCGLPQPEAQSFITGLEQHDRAYYTGYLGPVNLDARLALFVNLRCLQLSAEEFVLYLGGGILADSNELSEWQETEAKARTLLAILERE